MMLPRPVSSRTLVPALCRTFCSDCADIFCSDCAGLVPALCRPCADFFSPPCAGTNETAQGGHKDKNSCGRPYIYTRSPSRAKARLTLLGSEFPHWLLDLSRFLFDFLSARPFFLGSKNPELATWFCCTLLSSMCSYVFPSRTDYRAEHVLVTLASGKCSRTRNNRAGAIW